MTDNVRKVCGHSKKQRKKCECPWHFHYKERGGTHHRFSLDKYLGKHVDSKSEAIEEAATIRKAIKAGTFGQAVPREAMTVRQLADTYVERYVDVERAATKPAFDYALNAICRTVVPRPTGGEAPLGDWRVTDVVTDTVERFREIRRGQGTGSVGVNRHVRQLRALYNWGIRVGYVEQTPFKRGSEPVIELTPEPKRGRRLQEGEAEQLLTVSAPPLAAVIVCALETGMRRGEITSLQWAQVEGMQIDDDAKAGWTPRAAIVLPWTKTKTKRDRRIPISMRLKGILEMRRLDPAGQVLAGDRYVFGTAIGTRVTDFTRAWETAVLKAHGHKPTYTATANLSPESRAALAAIDLHFHDLRREAGSRWLEGGVPLHTVRDWLGHTSIAQTSTYLAGTLATQHDAMRRFEAHQAALQNLATEVETGGRKRPRTAGRRPTKAHKIAVGRDQATM